MKDNLKLLSFSGGVDSTALAIYLINEKIEFTPVFCDTGWEHPSTMEYINYINEKLFNGSLVTIKSDVYKNGMRDLVEKKKRVPSTKARFCTSELKVLPMIKYVSEVEAEVIFQGIRKDESSARSKMKKAEWSNDFDCYIERPIFDWTKKQCFDLLKENGIKQNPLYTKGCGRVGCFPCVMVNHGELKRVSEFYPEIWDNIRELEKLVGRSFFPPNYIPKRFQTGEDKGKSFPWAKDVQHYLNCEETPEFEQTSFLEPQSCMSIYNLCE